MGGLHHELFRVTSVGITAWRLDHHGRDASWKLMAANAAAAAISGAALGTAIGQRIVEGFPHASRIGLQQLLDEVAATRRTVRRPPAVWTNGDGHRRALLLVGHPLPAGWVAVELHDVTDHALVGSSPADRADTLTGLPGRGDLLGAVADRLCDGAGGTTVLAVVDLDRFRDVNHALGHDQGDLLLRQVAARLARVNPELVVGRLGSDDFGIIGAAHHDPESLGVVLSDAFSSPFQIGGLALRVTATVGVAVAPHDGNEPELLLRRATSALHTARSNGERFAVYTRDQESVQLRQLSLARELRAALQSTRGLKLHYQPKVELASGRITGAEALARWTHPDLGPVSPSEFVPIAEEHGLAGALTAWVLEESGRQAAEWQRSGFQLSVSANISPKNLYDPRLVRWLAKLVEQQGQPGLLTLELTENQLVSDLPMARQLLGRIQAMGVNLSVDDFGTGYSSLVYLSRLPLDELKIDKSFVLDLDGDHGEMLIQSIISLGHGLGLQVVAEGVETADVLHRLTGLGCDHAQGFHVSPALSAADLETWIAARSLSPAG